MRKRLLGGDARSVQRHVHVQADGSEQLPDVQQRLPGRDARDADMHRGSVRPQLQHRLPLVLRSLRGQHLDQHLRDIMHTMRAPGEFHRDV
jgi:hypothetical protein